MGKGWTVTGLIAALALASCSPPATNDQKADAGGATAPAPASPAPAPAPSPSGLQVGEWQTTVTVLDMSAPGVPAAALARIKAKPMVSSECVTSEDIKGFVGHNALESENDALNCPTNSLDTVGGKISGKAVCTDAEGMTRTLTMDGAYGAVAVDMTIAMEGTTPAGPMSQRLQVAARRIGECKS